MGRLNAVFVGLFSLIIFGATGTLAHEATPVAGAGEAINPAECLVAPRSVEEFEALLFDETDAGTPIVATPVSFADIYLDSAPSPLGEPADAETVAGVTATVREVLACANGGELWRALTLHSDQLLDRVSGPAEGITIEQVRAVLEAPAEPLPAADRYRLLAVTDVSVMKDGRVGAFVISDDPTELPEGVDTELILFVEERGRWVVDGIVEFIIIDEDN